jgi:putative ABC transport system substrate-binding protein
MAVGEAEPSVVLPVSVPDDLGPALEAAINAGADALFPAAGSAVGTLDGPRIVVRGATSPPRDAPERGFVEVGGLMSYGFRQTGQYRLAAPHVGKILRGANPAELPVELASEIEFVVNIGFLQGDDRNGACRPMRW